MKMGWKMKCVKQIYKKVGDDRQHVVYTRRSSLTRHSWLDVKAVMMVFEMAFEIRFEFDKRLTS